MIERRGQITRELAQVTNLQMREALISMLASEFSRELTLNGDSVYSAKEVEPPAVSARRTEPNLRLLFGVPMAAGAAIGLFLITLIAVLRRERRP